MTMTARHHSSAVKKRMLLPSMMALIFPLLVLRFNALFWEGQPLLSPPATTAVFNEAIDDSVLSPESIQREALRLARPYSAPNITISELCQNKGNIVLVKMPKAGSSTSASLTIRLLQTYGCGRNIPRYAWDHGLAHTKPTMQQSRRRNRSAAPPVIYITSIRDPAARALSRIWFTHMSPSKNGPTLSDAQILRWLSSDASEQFGTTSHGQGGFQLRYAAPHFIAPEAYWHQSQPDQVLQRSLLLELVQQTMNLYQFVLVTERLDESLVALALTWNLPLQHVLVRSSKGPADAFYYHAATQACRARRSGTVSTAVQQFLTSPEWRARHYGDYLWHAVAQASLDQTIQRIGLGKFAQALAQYKAMQQWERTTCPQDILPCAANGTAQVDFSAQHCFVRGKDFACGHACMDTHLPSTSFR